MREKLVLEFWDRKNTLNLDNKVYYNFVNDFFIGKLRNDEMNGDIATNSLIEKNKKSSFRIISKEEGIIAGIEEASLLLKLNKIKINKAKKDGNKVKNKDVILDIYGNARKILSSERTILNVLQRMSGIATLTYNLNNKIKNKCRIAATRKTLWGLLDKKAVSLGNGLTHRLNLSDGILIKDNHLKALDNDFDRALNLAIKNAKKSKIFGTNSVGKKTMLIEAEISNREQAIKAALVMNKLKNKNSKKLFAIMFDNMKPLEIKKIINKLKNEKLYDNVLFEASGNINEKNIEKYSKSGVDIASLGFITHSAKALNMSMEMG